MRTLRVAAAITLLGAAGGCSSDGGEVMLTVSQAMSMAPSFAQLTAGNGVAVVDSVGVVHFSASAPAGILTIDIQGPLAGGDMLPLTAPSAAVSFTVRPTSGFSGGWSGGGGQLAVDGIDPYRLRFVSIPMRVASGSVTGTFLFDGSGSFK